MKILSIATVLLLALTARADFNAGIISVDIYVTYEVVSNTPYAGTGAIGQSGDVWNGVNLARDPRIDSLLNNDGSATSVQLTIQNGSYSFHPTTGTYALLFNTASAFAQASQMNQITGLTPNAQYDLYLYSFYDNGGINVNGIVFTTVFTRQSIFDSLTPDIEYSEHIVTADANGNLNMTPDNWNGGGAHGFSGFQLTPIPEPATLALAALGAAVIAGCRKFRGLL